MYHCVVLKVPATILRCCRQQPSRHSPTRRWLRPSSRPTNTNRRRNKRYLFFVLSPLSFFSSSHHPHHSHHSHFRKGKPITALQLQHKKGVIACHLFIIPITMFSAARRSLFAAAGRTQGLTQGKHTLVLVRHGESTWNQENKFTGWYDFLTYHNASIVYVCELTPCSGAACIIYIYLTACVVQVRLSPIREGPSGGCRRWKAAARKRIRIRCGVHLLPEVRQFHSPLINCVLSTYRCFILPATLPQACHPDPLAHPRGLRQHEHPKYANNVYYMAIHKLILRFRDAVKNAWELNERYWVQ